MKQKKKPSVKKTGVSQKQIEKLVDENTQMVVENMRQSIDDPHILALSMASMRWSLLREADQMLKDSYAAELEAAGLKPDSPYMPVLLSPVDIPHYVSLSVKGNFFMGSSKLRAIINIVADVLGIPIDILEDYFAVEMKALFEAIKKGDWGKAKDIILDRIFPKIKTKKFKDYLIKKKGKKEAMKILAKFVGSKFPIVLLVILLASLIANFDGVMDP